MNTKELDELAQGIVAEARRAPLSPGRSVAAIIRQRMAAEPADTQRRLRRRALELLADSGAGSEQEPTGWLTLEEAARGLRISPKALKRAFRSISGRRAFGWPQWRAHRWWIAGQVVDPALAPRYFAALPEEEPWPSESLPPWVDE